MNTSFCYSCNSLFFLNILETGMPAVCPTCVPIYSIAKNVSNSNIVSQEVKEVATIVCGGILLFVGAIYLNQFVNYLKG